MGQDSFYGMFPFSPILKRKPRSQIWIKRFLLMESVSSITFKKKNLHAPKETMRKDHLYPLSFSSSHLSHCVVFLLSLFLLQLPHAKIDPSYPLCSSSSLSIYPLPYQAISSIYDLKVWFIDMHSMAKNTNLFCCDLI